MTDKPAPEIDWGNTDKKPARYESDEQRRIRQMRLANEIAEKEEAHKSGVYRALILVILVVAMGCGGYLLYPMMRAYFKAEPPPVVAEPVNTPPPPPVAARLAETPIEAPQLPKEPEQAQAPAQIETKPPPDAAVIDRLTDRIAHSVEGIRLLTKDRDATQAAIVRSDMHIYGTYTASPSVRNADGLVHLLKNAVDLKGQMIATSGRNPNWNMLNDQDVIMKNLNAQIDNERTLIAHNQEVLQSVNQRLAKATAERDSLAAELVRISQ